MRLLHRANEEDQIFPGSCIRLTPEKSYSFLLPSMPSYTRYVDHLHFIHLCIMYQEHGPAYLRDRVGRSWTSDSAASQLCVYINSQYLTTISRTDESYTCSGEMLNCRSQQHEQTRAGSSVLPLISVAATLFLVQWVPLKYPPCTNNVGHSIIIYPMYSHCGYVLGMIISG